MTYAFFYPLIGGALPLTLCALCPVRVQPGRLCRWTLGAGLSTMTVGSVLSGVLEIYGTSSRLLGVYRVVGWLWVLAAAGLYAAGWFSPASRRPGRHCPGGESEKK